MSFPPKKLLSHSCPLTLFRILSQSPLNSNNILRSNKHSQKWIHIFIFQLSHPPYQNINTAKLESSFFRCQFLLLKVYFFCHFLLWEKFLHSTSSQTKRKGKEKSDLTFLFAFRAENVFIKFDLPIFSFKAISEAKRSKLSKT